LSRLQHLPSLHWRVEEAELFWARGELETAKRMMKTLIGDLETVCFTCFMLMLAVYDVFSLTERFLIVCSLAITVPSLP